MKKAVRGAFFNILTSRFTNKILNTKFKFLDGNPSFYFLLYIQDDKRQMSKRAAAN